MIKSKTTVSNPRHRESKGTGMFFLLVSTFLTFKMITAQTKTIKFENATWEEIKARSVSEEKLIFLDAYASWCGICKKMDKNVFTNDSVADNFNANFINARIDMESDEGVGIARQYNITVYPTFLFIDGHGRLKHRSTGALLPNQLIELGAEARDPERQETDISNTYETASNQEANTHSNKVKLGFNISQYQRDFGIGLHIISPYFMMRSIAIKAGTNIQWFESTDEKETRLTSYQNIQLGMRGRSLPVTHNINVYGEGGVFIIIPDSEFSSLNLVVGGYGLFGFEFNIAPRFGYFIELGGVGTGASADKIAGKPIYSNGFLTNTGLKIGF